MFEKLKKILSNRDIVLKIIYTFIILLVFKLGTFTPIPLIDTVAIRETIKANDFLTILNAFSGGGLSNFSILALGISPYITSSIIVQMLQMVIPQLKELADQGEVGKTKLNITEINEILADLEHQMYEAAKKLDFEYATILRDSIMELKAEYKIK